MNCVAWVYECSKSLKSLHDWRSAQKKDPVRLTGGPQHRSRRPHLLAYAEPNHAVNMKQEACVISYHSCL